MTLLFSVVLVVGSRVLCSIGYAVDAAPPPPFNALFASTSSDEALAILRAEGYLDEVVPVPKDLTGWGVLEYLDYNNNAHTKNDGKSYRGLLYPQLRAWQVGDALRSLYERDRKSFLNRHYSPNRIGIVTGTAIPPITRARYEVKLPCWSNTRQPTPHLAPLYPIQWMGAADTGSITRIINQVTFSTSGVRDEFDYYTGTIIFFNTSGDGAYTQWAHVIRFEGGKQKVFALDRKLDPLPLPGDRFICLTPPLEVKRALNSRRPGERFVVLSGLLYRVPIVKEGLQQHAWLDDHFGSGSEARGQNGIRDTILDELLRNAFPLYCGSLRNRGVVIDGVVSDRETIPLLLGRSNLSQNLSVSETAVVGEAGSSYLEDELGFPLATIGKIQSDRGYISNDQYRELNCRWTNVFLERHAHQVESLYGAMSDRFRNLRFFTDFESARRVPQHQPAGRSFGVMNFLGPGTSCGSHQTAYCYGSVELPFSVKANAFSRPKVGAHWTLPTLPELPHETLESKWAAFISDMAIYRSMRCASFKPLAIWKAHKSYNSDRASGNMGSLLYDSTLYEESIWHALLHGALLHYWNEDGSHDDMPFQNAISEFVDVVNGNEARCRSFDPITFEQDIVSTACDVGDETVWRVTINPTVTASVTSADKVLTISAGDSRISIPGGQIYSPGKGISSLGFWVHQRRPT